MCTYIYIDRDSERSDRERNRKREREREHNLVIGVIGFGRLPIKRPDR